MADRTSLSRATESSDAPTPGYLFLDIARSAASSPAGCRETAQYLIRRLQNKQNHNIKFKCLKVIQKTAESSLTRGQFKREICQDPSAIAAIKQALQFRGPPDPVRGDAIYEKVRTAAKECLDAVYSDSPSSEMAIGSSHNAGLAGGITTNYGQSVYGNAPNQGMGIGSSGGGIGGGGGLGMGGKKMEGIGNPMFKDPRLASNQKDIGRMTIGEVASVVGSTVAGMIKDPLAKSVRPRHSMPSVSVNYNQNSNRIGNLPGYGGGGGGYERSSNSGYGGSSYNSQPPGARELSQSTGGAWTMATNRGPNAIGGASAPAPSGVGGSWASPPPRPSGQPSIAAQARAQAHGISPAMPITSSYQSTQGAGAAASDGSYERNLIEELCPPGGLRPEPPNDKLAAFAKSVPSLNADLVCPFLLDNLEDGQPWIKKAKTLCVIETTIKTATETMGDSNAYSDFFHTCAAEIEPLASHSRPAIRDPAKRVMKALGIAIASNHSPYPQTTANQPAPPIPEPAPPQPPPPPPPVNLLDFGEDDFGSSTAPTTEPPTPPPVPPPETSPPIPTAQPRQNSLFGGLQVNGGVNPTSKAAPASAQTSNNTQSAFGFITSAPSSTPNANENLPVTANNNQMPVETKAKDELLDLAAPSSTNAMSNPPVFDPLLSMGNPTPASQPKLSNSQIEAMSYQQNMLMMQQRMQQMQLAMVMQQQQQQGSSARGNMNMAQQPMMAGNFIPDMNMLQPMGKMGGKKMGEFSILESAKKAEQQKSFDFIKDTIKDAK